MPLYTCYIKSHCEAPDWEYSLEAESFEEAVEAFSKKAHWEKAYIAKYVYKEKD